MNDPKRRRTTLRETTNVGESEFLSVGASDQEDVADLRVGYIPDFISGRPVRATPEEVEAVQVFARRLVEDFGYPPDLIQMRPQFRVRPRPSESRQRGYPVDIAVFTSNRRLEDDVFILVECKKKTRRDGEQQLKIYMTMSNCQVGVWFNGKDHLYLLKKYISDGTIEWSVLPTLPRYQQSITDIGLLRRRQLAAPTNLKVIFRDIRNHLAGNATGITRDQALTVEMTAILFCKIYDEINTKPDDLPSFRAGHEEPADSVRERINILFHAVKKEYPDVFDAHEIISLDSDSLNYVVGELQNFCLIDAPRDAIGEAFEVFIGPAVRGEEGQFFTPRNVVHMMVQVVDPKPGEMIIDPACGSGGFLIAALKSVWSKLDKEAELKH